MRAAAALLALLFLPAVASAQTVVINTNITTDTTWGPTGTVVGDVFWVQASIAVNPGVTLTIEPGVIVKFNTHYYLTVNGTLAANGSFGNEIIFTSIKDDFGGDTNGDGNATIPAQSDWGGLTFPDAAPDASTLDYCDVRYAGYYLRGALLFASNSSSVTNSVVRASYHGIDCQGSAAPTLTNTTIEASTLTPIVLDFTAAPVLSSLVFSSANNGYDAFGVRGGILTSTATLPQRGATVGVNPITNITYVLLSPLAINSGGDLTINPGVVIKPLSGGITVNSGGNLTMNGTAAAGDTITITSINDDNVGKPGDTNNNGSITAPAPGNWTSVAFADGATGSVQHARLKFGTSSASQGMIQMTNNAIGVSNTLLSDASHGLALFGTSTPVIDNVDINNCTSTPVLQSVAADPSYSNIDLTANAITAIGLHGEVVGVDSRIPIASLGGFDNITYYIMNGRITMNSPAILTIDPGVVIKNELYGGGLTINGGMVADGKFDSLIVFTSVRDDLYGNPADTNGDGASTSPAPGDWSYLQYTATSNDGVDVLDYCRVTYASQGPYTGGSANVWIQNASPSITNSVISNGSYGIRLDGASSPLIDQCVISNFTYAPILMSAVSDPNITVNNTYPSNGYNALALHSETLAQNATIKYRPGVGTPTFAYLPTGQITVASGVTLSIEPQVVLKPSGAFAVFNVNGSLNIVGSDNTTGRVVFTSQYDDNPLYGGDTTPTNATSPQAGNWGYIIFNDTSVDAECVVRNVLFQFGGAFGQSAGVLTALSASPTFASNEFFQNLTAMTFRGTSQASVDSTTILNCTQLPIVQSLVSHPQFPNPTNIVMANNTYTALGLLSETIAQDVTTLVQPLGSIDNIPYVPTGTINIAFGAKWTIAPGVVIKLGRRFVDPFGLEIHINGTLVADGKPDSLIVFTSLADDEFGGDVQGDGAATVPVAGNWHGILFASTSDDINTVVDHVRTRYGGYGGWGALNFVTSGPTITNTDLSINSSYGALIQGASTPTFVNCRMDSSFAPVHMSLVSNPTFTNVDFLGNTYTALSVIAETIAQDVLWPIRAVAGRNNMPYYLTGQLTVGLGATMTLQPGLIVKGNGAHIFVQRAFVAEGTTDSLIIFTSYRDDFYGGDTNNDSTLTAPAAGNWYYVTVDGTAIDPQVRFKNCIFRYGGSGTTLGALRAVNSSPSVDSCLFAYNTVGVSVEGASNPTINGSSLYSNTYYAVNNTGNSFCVNAQGNWWGAADGPNDASAVADLCALGANAGSGNAVSNNVDYTSWSTAGIQNPLLGDVSLNGSVLAYDASLVLQANVVLIVLTPLQELVADVSGDLGVTAYDASLILQWVAGLIDAFPAASNGAQQALPDVLAAREVVDRSVGQFEVVLGSPYREGDEWVLPVNLTGTAPAMSLELLLEGAGAGALQGVAPRSMNTMNALEAGSGVARVALAGVQAMGEGEVLLLRFEGDADWAAPALTWARVNENELRPAPVGTPSSAPRLSFAARPFPNPAASPVHLSLGISESDANGPASIAVYDISGRVVQVLHEGPLSAGVHEFQWNLSRRDGSRLAPGIYMVRSRTLTLDDTHRLVVVR